MNLHERLLLLPKKYTHIKEHLIAVKWLGNAGSHSGGSVTQYDVSDAYELLEFALRAIYDDSAKKLTMFANRVNKRKGPLKRQN